MNVVVRSLNSDDLQILFRVTTKLFFSHLYPRFFRLMIFNSVDVFSSKVFNVSEAVEERVSVSM